MTAPIHHLTIEQLHAEAQEVARPTDARRHWSRLATILGRLHDEELYKELGYGSLLAYTSMVMSLSEEEVFEPLRLWRMIQAASVEVPITDWEKIPKTYATRIRKLVSEGASAKEWVEIALACKTFVEFDAAVCRFLDKEQWVTIATRAPKALADIFDSCLVATLPEATGEPDANPDLIYDRAVRFRCLEVILRNFAETYVAQLRSDLTHSDQSESLGR